MTRELFAWRERKFGCAMSGDDRSRGGASAPPRQIETQSRDSLCSPDHRENAPQPEFRFGVQIHSYLAATRGSRRPFDVSGFG
jgi:hypothetical protein